MTLANETTLAPAPEAPFGIAAAGVRRVEHPRPLTSTDDLARAIAAVDQTLSEVLVLLYHVVHANQALVDSLHDQARRGPLVEKGRA